MPSRYCDECRRRANAPTLPSPASGGPLTVTRLPVRLIDLPINASEGRLVGSIDIEAAVRAGTRRFQPGVLAEANRNLLYIDEVNLLDDHLVDVLLDAAAMGVNVVEREGMSVVHPSHFILVGTMNPEEGELRPQLLDRFGLCVDVVTLTDIDARMRVMELERDFLQSPHAVQRVAAEGEARLRALLQAATDRLMRVSLPEATRPLIARLCLDGSVAGHRADLVVARTARAICALRGGPVVELPDVLEALELALAHGRREPLSDKQAQVQELASRAAEQLAQIQAAAPNETAPSVRSDVTQQEGASGGESNEGWTTSESRESPTNEAIEPESDAVIQLRTFTVKKLDLPRERQARRAAGKRTSTKSETKRGRYVRSSQTEKVTDVAFDATVRAAAPHQLSRRQAAPDSTNQLQRQDATNPWMDDGPEIDQDRAAARPPGLSATGADQRRPRQHQSLRRGAAARSPAHGRPDQARGCSRDGDRLDPRLRQPAGVSAKSRDEPLRCLCLQRVWGPCRATRRAVLRAV